MIVAAHSLCRHVLHPHRLVFHPLREISSGKFHQSNAMNRMMAFSMLNLDQLAVNKATQQSQVCIELKIKSSKWRTFLTISYVI